MALVYPLKNYDPGQYEGPVDTSVDQLVACGFYPQNSGTPDLNVGIEREAGTSKLILKTASTNISLRIGGSEYAWLDTTGLLSASKLSAVNNLYSPNLDTASGVALTIGGTNATSINMMDPLFMPGTPDNATARPPVAAARIPGEIAGARVAAPDADDGLVRLSAGGGTNASTKSFIDLSGYSTVADMDRNIVFGVGGAEQMRLAGSGLSIALGKGLSVDRTHLNCIRVNNGSTFTNGCLITTKIPWAMGQGMCTLHLIGYNYGAAAPIGLSLSFYLYNTAPTTVVNPGLWSFGKSRPTITIGNIGGFACIYLTGLAYYASFSVQAFGGASPAEMSGWTWADAAPSWAAGTNYTFPYQDVAGASNLGYLSAADWTAFNGKQAALGFTPVPNTRQVIAGAGLTGGGALSADVTLNVVANADGSIVVAADSIQVGVLATDAQHGTRGGGTLHAVVVAAGAAGFMSGADKTKLDGIATGAQVNDTAAQILAKLITLDGAGSGLDADLLDGQQGSYYQAFLQKSMFGGYTYDSAVDLNTLNTTFEARFLQSNQTNGPGVSGMSYYFGLAGGDTAGRGIQLVADFANFWWRERSVGTWRKFWHDGNLTPGNYAPLASPALSGAPTAPTAAALTNTTQLATTQFVLSNAGTASPLMDGTVAVGTGLRYAREDHRHPTDTSTALPTGTVLSFAGSAAPSGYLLCDGAAVSRTTYAALYAVVGTTYGTGDGSTTFNVPDGRSRTVVGAGQGAGLTNRTRGGGTGAAWGEESHTLSQAEMPSHTHVDTGHDHGGAVFAGNTHSHRTAIGFDSSGTLFCRANSLYMPMDGSDVQLSCRFTAGLTQVAESLGRYAFTGSPSTAAAIPSGSAAISSTGSGSAHNSMPPFLVMNYIIKT
jgi:microcystin-dependent protein